MTEKQILEYVKEQLKAYYCFQPLPHQNTAELRKHVEDSINQFLSTVNPGISVICDSSNNPEDGVTDGLLNVDIVFDDGYIRSMNKPWT